LETYNGSSKQGNPSRLDVLSRWTFVKTSVGKQKPLDNPKVTPKLSIKKEIKIRKILFPFRHRSTLNFIPN